MGIQDNGSWELSDVKVSWGPGRASEKLKQPKDFTGCWLRRLDFSEANIERKSCFDFSYCEISGFSGLHLKRAGFQGAKLHSAQFVESNLSEADFSSANVYASDFTNARLDNARFSSRKY